MTKSFGRTFGQDLMRGEHIVGAGGGKAMNASAILGGGTGANSAYMFRQPDGGYEAETEAQQTGSGTSIFDPVICELAYKWFSPPNGIVLDPFAGGSVRGIVASRMGRQYIGVELRGEQVAANREQLHLAGEPAPEWRQGDSARIESLCADVRADFLFSCPPYGNLEVYSDDPADLSAMPDADFDLAYTNIIRAAAGLLKPDRFACFVVGDYRDKVGFYRNFPGKTVAAFEAAGCRLYNEVVLVTAVGSLPLRVSRQFAASRKLGRTHQTILIFVKGDPKIATRAMDAIIVHA
jgi:hypothetical protein